MMQMLKQKRVEQNRPSLLDFTNEQLGRYVTEWYEQIGPDHELAAKLPAVLPDGKKIRAKLLYVSKKSKRNGTVSTQGSLASVDSTVAAMMGSQSQATTWADEEATLTMSPLHDTNPREPGEEVRADRAADSASVREASLLDALGTPGSKEDFRVTMLAATPAPADTLRAVTEKTRLLVQEIKATNKRRKMWDQARRNDIDMTTTAFTAPNQSTTDPSEREQLTERGVVAMENILGKIDGILERLERTEDQIIQMCENVLGQSHQAL